MNEDVSLTLCLFAVSVMACEVYSWPKGKKNNKTKQTDDAFLKQTCVAIHYRINVKTYRGAEFLYQHFCVKHFVTQNIFFQSLPSAFMCEDVDKDVCC